LVNFGSMWVQVGVFWRSGKFNWKFVYMGWIASTTHLFCRVVHDPSPTTSRITLAPCEVDMAYNVECVWVSLEKFGLEAIGPYTNISKRFDSGILRI
jgi:hypothetical protein